jgi:hypothetical protein
MALPEALIEEVSYRRCVIFFGAGASAGAKSAAGEKMPTWSELLGQLSSALVTGDKTFVDELISSNRYLDAAEIIRAKVDSGDFANILRRTLGNPNLKASNIHEVVHELDPKIALTTNYDEIYEKYCKAGAAARAYNVCKHYETHLVNDLRSSIRLIVKVHGCLSDPSQVVLSRSDYFRSRRQHASFYRVLDAIFLTNTVLFVGYSLSDPDIQLVLENANIAFDSSRRHYAFIANDTNPILREASSRAFNIQFIEYPTGDYVALEGILRDLSGDVLTFRSSRSLT